MVLSSGMREAKALIFICQGCRNKYHRLGALNNRNLFPQSPGGQKSKTKVSADLVLFEASLPGTDGHLLTVPSHGLCSVRTHPRCLSVLMSPCKDTSQIRLGPSKMASFQLNYLFKGPVSKYLTF